MFVNRYALIGALWTFFGLIGVTIAEGLNTNTIVILGLGGIAATIASAIYAYNLIYLGTCSPGV